MVADRTLYGILGVEPEAGERDLRLVYKRKAMELHPDKNRDDPEATEKS
jgi:DnaJ family protein A protein 2